MILLTAMLHVPLIDCEDRLCFHKEDSIYMERPERKTLVVIHSWQQEGKRYDFWVASIVKNLNFSPFIAEGYSQLVTVGAGLATSVHFRGEGLATSF